MLLTVSDFIVSISFILEFLILLYSVTPVDLILLISILNDSLVLSENFVISSTIVFCVLSENFVISSIIVFFVLSEIE